MTSLRQRFINLTPELLFVFFSLQTLYMMASSPDGPWKFFRDSLASILVWVIGYRALDIHKKYGFFKAAEPWSHFVFQFKNGWTILCWLFATFWISVLLGVRPQPPHVYMEKLDWMIWEFPAWMRVEEERPVQKWIMILVIYLVIDYCRYWTHRIGHMQFFYRTFPFSHAQHHNQVWLHPWSFVYQSFFHMTLWATVAPSVLFWGFGFKRATILANLFALFPNLNQHMGMDPFPWITTINHKYCYGLLPWLPLAHQYHHIPYVKRGNYGNITMFWDYYYGTVIPEFAQHAETGKMPERIWAKFRDPEKLEAEFAAKLAKRNRLDFNRNIDSSIFNLRYM